MPNPEDLKVGDKVRFIGMPEEWSDPHFRPPKKSKRFMKYLLQRKSPSLVSWIDEYGHPWIEARLTISGKHEHHTWAIFEKTGWRKVKKRTRR